jgi:hypothetical protein
MISKRVRNVAWEAVKLFKVALRRSRRDGMIKDVEAKVITLGLGLKGTVKGLFQSS